MLRNPKNEAAPRAELLGAWSQYIQIVNNELIWTDLNWSAHLHSCGQSGWEIEEGPQGTEAELDHEPGDDVELLHGVSEVHEERHQADPEGRHGNKHKPLADRLFSVVRGGEHHADEANQVAQLECDVIKIL